MSHAFAHWIGVVAMAGVAAWLAVTVVPAELDGHREPGWFHALDPVEVVVERAGSDTPTGISALAVIAVVPGSIVFDVPMPLVRLPLEAPTSGGSVDNGASSTRVSAWTAALEATGVPAPHGLLLSGPVAAPLREGDIVVTMDGRPVTRLALRRPWPDRRRLLTVVRGGVTQAIDIPTGYRPGHLELQAVGAAAGAPRLPSLEAFQGASAGLAMALAYVQILSAGDLTAGRRVAATGALEPGATPGDWRVTAIGSAGLKAAAAARAGVDVVLVPMLNADEARRAVSAFEGQVQIVPVDSVSSAVAWLCGHGGVVDLLDMT
jgi:hypothetical protein